MSEREKDTKRKIECIRDTRRNRDKERMIEGKRKICTKIILQIQRDRYKKKE